MANPDIEYLGSAYFHARYLQQAEYVYVPSADSSLEYLGIEYFHARYFQQAVPTSIPAPAPGPAPGPAPAPSPPSAPDYGYGPVNLGFQTDAYGYVVMKLAGATLDYGFDWTSWLNGDTIASSSWAVETGLTKGTDAITSDGRETTVFLSGGSSGEEYTVTNTVTTSNGRIDSRSFRVRVV